MFSTKKTYEFFNVLAGDWWWYSWGTFCRVEDETVAWVENGYRCSDNGVKSWLHLTVEGSRTSWKHFIVCCNLVIPDPAFGRPGPAGQSSKIRVGPVGRRPRGRSDLLFKAHNRLSCCNCNCYNQHQSIFGIDRPATMYQVSSLNFWCLYGFPFADFL